MTDKLAPSTRHKYEYQGRTIYEWDQAFSEVNIYVEVPPGVRAKQLFVDIKPNHLKLGISPNPPYIDVIHQQVVADSIGLAAVCRHGCRSLPAATHRCMQDVHGCSVAAGGPGSGSQGI